MSIKKIVYTKLIKTKWEENSQNLSAEFFATKNKYTEEREQWKSVLKNNPLAFNFFPTHLLNDEQFLNEIWNVLRGSVKKAFKVGDRKSKVLAREIILGRLDDEICHEDDQRCMWSGF